MSMVLSLKECMQNKRYLFEWDISHQTMELEAAADKLFDILKDSREIVSANMSDNYCWLTDVNEEELIVIKLSMGNFFKSITEYNEKQLSNQFQN
jgi:hypothetical protein